MKSFGKIATRAASVATKDKVDNTDKYIQLVMAVLEKAAAFFEWVDYIETAPHLEWSPQIKLSIWTHLNKICEFFYEVVCNIVLRDMKTVLKQYLRHCSRTVFH